MRRLFNGLALHRPGARRVPLRGAVHGAAVADRQARAADAAARWRSAILVVRLVDLFWLIAPEFHRTASVSWLDVVVPLTLVAVWLGCFIWQLRGRAFCRSTTRSSTRRSARSSSAGTRPSTADSHGSSEHRSGATRDDASVHHEDERRRHAGDLALRRVAGRRAALVVYVVVWVMFGVFDRREAAASVRGLPARVGQRSDCRRSRGFRSTPRQDLRALRAARRGSS